MDIKQMVKETLSEMNTNVDIIKDDSELIQEAISLLEDKGELTEEVKQMLSSIGKGAKKTFDNIIKEINHVADNYSEYGDVAKLTVTTITSILALRAAIIEADKMTKSSEYQDLKSKADESARRDKINKRFNR
jgi:CHASE3 domain sensor protein